MPKTRSILALAIAFSVSFPQPADAQQTPVSRTAPPAYDKAIAPLLTPLDQALTLSEGLEQDEDFGGAVILNEVIHRVDENGGRIVTIHSIYRADSESGAESLERDTQGFRSASQKIHLVRAQTISPDGTRTPVRPNATFIQSPQRNADQALYSDSQELVVIYPKIKPGTLTESIIVIEEDEMRVPGEFMTSTTWASGWPQARKRLVIDLPEALGKRLHFSPLGAGTPQPQRTEPATGRIRFELSQLGSSGYLWEIGRPPVSQAGPATWITTLADWDAFADWYRPLIKDRATLKPSLAAKVDEWTADAQDDDEIIARLLRRASNDVRYTGLEFGIAGLQPYDCNEVWENQYGDCKDKANLLRAMLAHKGIRSYLTLLNTDSTGRIEKRSPDYRQFNHAILAIEREGKPLLFCDPTIEFSAPGELAPSDADRDVLLIREDAAQFARTPSASAGHLDYHFDLDLNAAREIAGWLTLTATGNYASAYGSYFSKQDPQALNQATASILTQFYPTAEVVDIERPEWQGGDYELRAYFVAPGRDTRKLSLTFPYSNSIFPNLGETKSRRAPYYGVADHITIDATIRTPSELGSAQIPAPLGIDSSAIKAEANWQASPEGNHYRGQLDVVIKKPLFTAEEFQVAFGALTSLRSWLDAPLIFDKTKIPARTPPVAIDNFPLMPSLQGQLTLLDQRFPDDGNLEQRSAALLKVRQYFPDDQKAEFFVELNLAEIAWNQDRTQPAIDRLLKLLNSAASDAVDDEEIAWAEYVLAFCYRDMGNLDKAKQLFKEVAENAEVSDFRRGWAGYQRLSLLKGEEDPDYGKLAAETNALLDFETEARAYLVAMHCEFMIRNGESEKLQQRLSEIVGQNPEDLPEIVELIASVARELPAEESAGLIQLVSELEIDEKNPAAKTLAAELENLWKFRESAASYTVIQEKLRAFVAENRPEDWEADAKTNAEILDDLEGQGTPEDYLRLTALHLTTAPPDDRFAYFLWRMAAWGEYAKRVEISVFKKPLLPFLLDLCEQLPKSNPYYLEGRFLRGKVLGLDGQLDEEIAIYEQLFESDLLTTDAFVVAATVRLGNALELKDKPNEARKRYVTLKKFTQDYAVANDSLLKATLISLEFGQRDRAIDLIKHLAKTNNETLDTTPHALQIRSLIELGDVATDYWDASEEWWQLWEKLHTTIAAGAELKPVRVPAIGDPNLFGAPLRAAAQSEDKAAFYAKVDLLLRALRWSPNYLSDACSALIFLAPNLSPEAAGDLRALVIAICEDLPESKDEALRQRQLYHSLALVDSERPEDALPITEAFFESATKKDSSYYSMVRIRSIAASRVDGSDLEVPTKALEEILATRENDENRAQNIFQLANLYKLRDRKDDEEALLARELENPLIRNDERALASLAGRYQTLAREGNGAKDFTQAVEVWLDAHAPAWLDSCPPRSLADPRIGDDLESALEEIDSRFTMEESIKLGLLAAKSDRLSIDERESAFLSAFGVLHFDAATHRQARKMLTSVLDQDEFPTSLKQIALFGGLDSAVASRQPGDIGFLLAHPVLDRSNERLTDLIELYGHLASINFNSADSISKTISKLTDGGLSSAELGAVLQLFPRLLELGELTAAESVYKACRQWKLDPDVRATNNAIKLNLLKLLKYGRKTIPITAKLHAALAPGLGLERVTEPEWFSQRRHFDDLNDLSIADARSLRLWQVKTKAYDQTDPSFWFDVADAIQSKQSVPFAYQLLEIFLRETEDDARRASAAFFAPGVVDTDEPKIREQLRKIFAPYRELADAPLTRDAIRLYEINTDKLRTGQDFDIDEAFGSLAHPAARRMHLRAKLTQLIQQEDPAKLSRYLERMDGDRLLDTDYLDLTLPALKLGGLEDEAELAAETAIEKIPALIAKGWRSKDTRALGTAYQYAILLDRPELVPAAAFESLHKDGVKNERLRLGMEMMHHGLHKDWQKLEASASEAIRQFPTFYTFYLEKARALYQQGKKKEAIEPLEIFLKYGADDVELSKAKRWLEEAR